MTLMMESMRERIEARSEALRGSKFRWINEQMYTSDSASARDMFAKDESRFHLVRSLFGVALSASLHRLQSRFLIVSSSVPRRLSCPGQKVAAEPERRFHRLSEAAAFAGRR
jgi:hypothetical protein